MDKFDYITATIEEEKVRVKIIKECRRRQRTVTK